MADIDLKGYGPDRHSISSARPRTVRSPASSTAITRPYRTSGRSRDFGGYLGLFGLVEGLEARIENLTLADPNIASETGRYVGTLIGALRRRDGVELPRAGRRRPGNELRRRPRRQERRRHDHRLHRRGGRPGHVEAGRVDRPELLRPDRAMPDRGRGAGARIILLGRRPDRREPGGDGEELPGLLHRGRRPQRRRSARREPLGHGRSLLRRGHGARGHVRRRASWAQQRRNRQRLLRDGRCEGHHLRRRPGRVQRAGLSLHRVQAGHHRSLPCHRPRLGRELPAAWSG